MKKHKSFNSIYSSYEDLQRDLENLNFGRLNDIFGDILNLYEGIAIGLDFGAIWEIPIKDSEHKVNVGIMLEDFPTYSIAIMGLLSRLDYVFNLKNNICQGVLGLNPEEDIGDLINNLCDRDIIPESTFFIPNAKLGIAYFLSNYLGNYFRDILFAIDFHRIGAPDYNFSDMYHLGMSTSIFDFTDEESGRGYRMNLSMGINQNQFNIGFLFHLKVYEIAYNYFSETIAGSNSSFVHHIFTFAFYF